MRPQFLMFSSILATLLLAGCASGPKPMVTMYQEDDAYADVRIGPISYTTPVGVVVPDVNGTGGGWVDHIFLDQPEITGSVSYEAQPPSNLKLDADRRVRAFLASTRGGSVNSIQHSYRGTAEVVKYTTTSPALKGTVEPRAGSLIVMRQDGKSVTISTSGPKRLQYEIDAAAESLSDQISFTPDRVPSRLTSVLGQKKDDFREEASGAKTGM
jgi:hypothetical protein